MTDRRWRTRLLAPCALALAFTAAPLLRAQTQPSTHNLALTSATETVDAKGRLVLVANVKGDLPGVLTMALQVGADGMVTGGEWALNVSYVQFGAMSSDGDASESLVQLGYIKGSVSRGAATLAHGGGLTALTGIQLNVTGATVQFAHTTKGSGNLTGSRLDNHTAPIGTLNLTF